MENAKTHFILKGFSQIMEFRVFEFEGISASSARASFTVRTDLALARKHGIRLQELPLLCRKVLDQYCDEQAQRVFTFTETEMCSHTDNLAALEEAAKHRKRRASS